MMHSIEFDFKIFNRNVEIKCKLSGTRQVTETEKEGFTCYFETNEVVVSKLRWHRGSPTFDELSFQVTSEFNVSIKRQWIRNSVLKIRRLGTIAIVLIYRTQLRYIFFTTQLFYAILSVIIYNWFIMIFFSYFHIIVIDMYYS